MSRNILFSCILNFKQKFVSIVCFIIPNVVNLGGSIPIHYKLSEIREPKNASSCRVVVDQVPSFIALIQRYHIHHTTLVISYLTFIWESNFTL